MSFSLHIFPIDSISCITPISLFTCIIDIKIVVGLIAAFNTSKSNNPSSLGFKYVTSKPSPSKNLIVSKTALCSVVNVMR